MRKQNINEDKAAGGKGSFNGLDMTILKKDILKVTTVRNATLAAKKKAYEFALVFNAQYLGRGKRPESRFARSAVVIGSNNKCKLIAGDNFVFFRIKSLKVYSIAKKKITPWNIGSPGVSAAGLYEQLIKKPKIKIKTDNGELELERCDA